MMPNHERLFDPRTRDRIRRDLARGTATVFAVVTLVGAGLTGAAHHERPFLPGAALACSREDASKRVCAGLDLLAGALGLLVFGGVSLIVYRYRRIRPTVRCESCGGVGWVMDLEPREGRCPRCAGSRFSYCTDLPGGDALGPVVRRIEEEHADGAALVRRFRETRRSLFDRYY